MLEKKKEYHIYVETPINNLSYLSLSYVQGMGMNTKFVFEYLFFYIQIYLNVQILTVTVFYFAL